MTLLRHLSKGALLQVVQQPNLPRDARNAQAISPVGVRPISITSVIQLAGSHEGRAHGASSAKFHQAVTASDKPSSCSAHSMPCGLHARAAWPS